MVLGQRGNLVLSTENFMFSSHQNHKIANIFWMGCCYGCALERKSDIYRI